jgi:hypothetical protein
MLYLLANNFPFGCSAHRKVSWYPMQIVEEIDFEEEFLFLSKKFYFSRILSSNTLQS